MLWKCLSIALIMVLNHMHHAQAEEPVRDRIVKEWILTSLTEYNVQAPGEARLNELLKNRRSVAKLENAWGDLKACRDSGMSLNLNLAAAEHYMFMRFLSAKDGDTAARQLPEMYELVKRKAKEHNAEAHMQTTQEPVSSPNSDVTRWGKEGVEEGLRDYTYHNGIGPTMKTYAIAEAFGLAVYIYLHGPTNVKSACELRNPEADYDLTPPAPPAGLIVR